MASLRILWFAGLTLMVPFHALHAQSGASTPPESESVPFPNPLVPQELAPGVFVMASSHAQGDANTGWLVEGDEALLIGAPGHENTARALAHIELAGLRVTRAVLTHLRTPELAGAGLLAARGVTLITHPEGEPTLREAAGAEAKIEAASDTTPLPRGARFILLADHAGSPELAVFVPGTPGVLFAGELVTHGPRAPLPGTNTALWLKDLAQLRALQPDRVVPGRGYVAGPEALERMSNFLTNLRQQVGHKVARGEPIERILAEVRLPTMFSASMPYDFPAEEDIRHLHSELTVPNAPFYGRPFDPADKRPRALVIYGDQVHDPLHLGPALERMLETAGIDARFSVDPAALSAENLAQVDLFVILRDGTWFANPTPQEPIAMWMQPGQEQALRAFVERGGGLLALHNCTGLYPEGGLYLDTLGGTYNGHGPLEHFSVRVTDPLHPITQGIETYQIWDEQHTPTPQAADLHHLLESTSAEGIISSAGWTRTMGKGRVCYLANGHSREAINHPVYQRLMVQAAQWCLAEKAPQR